MSKYYNGDKSNYHRRRDYRDSDYNNGGYHSGYDVRYFKKT